MNFYKYDTSVLTYQCCGSGMFIPDPDFLPTPDPDPKTSTKERGENKFFVPQISQN
jgi:hypothetical protein